MTDAVTRSMLRAELSEMELRLHSFVATELRTKADLAPFTDFSLQLAMITKGEWTPAQRLAIIDLITQQVVARSGASWTARERAFALLAAIIGLLSFALTVAVTAHGW